LPETGRTVVYAEAAPTITVDAVPTTTTPVPVVVESVVAEIATMAEAVLTLVATETCV